MKKRQCDGMVGTKENEISWTNHLLGNWIKARWYTRNR